MNETNDYLYKKKAFLYREKGQVIHVKLTKGIFYNGKIAEIKEEFFILRDRKIGDVFVFFSEVDKLEPYEEVKA